jgi:hypothetical protein
MGVLASLSLAISVIIQIGNCLAEFLDTCSHELSAIRTGETWLKLLRACGGSILERVMWKGYSLRPGRCIRNVPDLVDDQ